MDGPQPIARSKARERLLAKGLDPAAVESFLTSAYGDPAASPGARFADPNVAAMTNEGEAVTAKGATSQDPAILRAQKMERIRALTQGMAANALQGATLNMAGRVAPNVKSNEEELLASDPMKARAANLAGNLLPWGAALSGTAKAVKALQPALTGIGRVVAPIAANAVTGGVLGGIESGDLKGAVTGAIGSAALPIVPAVLKAVVKNPTLAAHALLGHGKYLMARGAWAAARKAGGIAKAVAKEAPELEAQAAKAATKATAAVKPAASAAEAAAPAVAEAVPVASAPNISINVESMRTAAQGLKRLGLKSNEAESFARQAASAGHDTPEAIMKEALRIRRGATEGARVSPTGPKTPSPPRAPASPAPPAEAARRAGEEPIVTAPSKFKAPKMLAQPYQVTPAPITPAGMLPPGEAAKMLSPGATPKLLGPGGPLVTPPPALPKLLQPGRGPKLLNRGPLLTPPPGEVPKLLTAGKPVPAPLGGQIHLIEDAGAPTKRLVFKDAEGVERGDMTIYFENGKAVGQSVDISPEFQRQGIGSALYDMAEKAGFTPLENAGKETGLTTAGKAFTDKLKVRKQESASKAQLAWRAARFLRKPE